jgi:hypothetical protein
MGKLRAVVTNVEKTSEKYRDQYDTVWEKCVVEIEIIGASKRFKDETLLQKLTGRRAKIIRWCAYDWHCKVGTRITLDVEELQIS